jgi:hypothetical protein
MTRLSERAILVILFVIVAGLLAGCATTGPADLSTPDRSATDPSAPVADDGTGDATQKGTIDFAIYWPVSDVEARLIPTATVAIRYIIQAEAHGEAEASGVITKADVVDNVANVTCAVSSGPGKIITVAAVDDQSRVVSEAEATVDVIGGQNTQVALNLTPTGITMPVVTATVDPEFVTVNGSVSLIGTATDPDGTIDLYEWDTNNDGTFDWSSTTSGTATVTPTTTGWHEARFRATDNDGLSTTSPVVRYRSTPENLEWLVMVYIGAANNLEDYAFSDMNEMEALELPVEVGIVCQVDTTVDYYSANEYADGKARRFEIQHDSSTSQFTSPMIEDLGVVNSGDWNELKEFVDWACAAYPANRRVLVLWDHGSGWKDGSRPPVTKGVCSDDDAGGYIATADIPDALVDVPGGSLDILCFDACLMQMAEVAYEVRDNASFVCASEQNIPGDGYNYTYAFGPISTDPYITTQACAEGIVNGYQTEYSSYPWGVDLSAIDATKLGALKTAVDALAARGLAVAGTGSFDTEWSDSISGAATISSWDGYVDLGDLMDQVQTNVTDADFKTAATGVQTALDNSVVHSWSSVSELEGLSIWAPTSTPSGGETSLYSGLAWSAGADGWDEWIADYTS